MKKIMALTIAVIMAIGLFTISASADDNKLPGGYFFFSDSIKYAKGVEEYHFKGSGTMAGSEVTEDGLLYLEPKASNGKPKTTFTFMDRDDIKGLDVTQYPICVLKVTLSRELDPDTTKDYNKGYLDINSSNGKPFEFEYTNTTEPQIVVADYSTLSETSLEKVVLYPLSDQKTSAGGLGFSYEYIAFFKTVEEVEVLKSVYNGDLVAYIQAGGAGSVTPENPGTENPDNTEQPDTGDFGIIALAFAAASAIAVKKKKFEK